MGCSTKFQDIDLAILATSQRVVLAVDGDSAGQELPCWEDGSWKGDPQFQSTQGILMTFIFPQDYVSNYFRKIGFLRQDPRTLRLSDFVFLIPVTQPSFEGNLKKVKIKDRQSSFVR